MPSFFTSTKFVCNLIIHLSIYISSLLLAHNARTAPTWLATEQRQQRQFRTTSSHETRPRRQRRRPSCDTSSHK